MWKKKSLHGETAGETVGSYYYPHLIVRFLLGNITRYVILASRNNKRENDEVIMRTCFQRLDYGGHCWWFSFHKIGNINSPRGAQCCIHKALSIWRFLINIDRLHGVSSHFPGQGFSRKVFAYSFQCHDEFPCFFSSLLVLARIWRGTDRPISST